MAVWRAKKIIQLLRVENDYVSSQTLAKAVNVSSKTVLNDLKNLSNIIEKHGGKIISAPGHGIKLEILDEKKMDDYVNQIEGARNDFISLSLETKILYYLLFSRKNISVNTICRELYISPSTLLYYIKKIRNIVSVYNLKIENKRNSGFQIVGTEFEKRLCMSQYISVYKALNETDSILSTYINRKVFNDVDKTISRIFREEQLSMSYINYENFINYLVVAISEIKFGDFIEGLNNPIDEEVVSIDLVAARKITERLSQKFEIEFSVDEELFIAILLFTTRSIPIRSTEDKIDANRKKEFSDLVIAMLEKIHTSTGMDFTNNQNLVSSLNKHIIPLYVRLLYGIKTENTSLEEIKRYCIFAYNLAAIGVSVLVENLNVNIDDNEIGYIALYLKMAIEEEEKNKFKKSVLFISDQQASNMMLYLHELRKNFDEYIKELVWKDFNQVTQAECDNYDLVISTSKLDFVPINQVVEVKRVVDMTDFKIIENHLSDRVLMKDKILEFYSEDLFFLDIDTATKEECIHEICERVSKVIDLPDYFEEFVLYRELFGSTDFGECIAIPHPYIPIASKSFISTTILKKPILWGKNKVYVVFLLSLNQYELPPAKFYDLMSELLSSASFVDTLFAERNFNSMIRKISEILDSDRYSGKNEK